MGWLCVCRLRAQSSDAALEELARRARKLQAERLPVDDFAHFLDLPLTDTLAQVHGLFDQVTAPPGSAHLVESQDPHALPAHEAATTIRCTKIEPSIMCSQQMIEMVTLNVLQEECPASFLADSGDIKISSQDIFNYAEKINT